MRPTIRLPTTEDMRAITSQNLDAIKHLPHMYIATDELGAMRVWGVALESSFQDFERLNPGALVAPCYVGETASRSNLIGGGAEPASNFVQRA